MDGIELAIRFSDITNRLQFCGPDSAQKAFWQYVQKKDNKEDVVHAFKRFEGLYPYLKLIAEKTGKDFLDYDVVEAYWIGNTLLDQFGDEDIKELIRTLVKRGLPASIAEPLIEKLPPGFVLHHTFNVIYVGVGKTTGAVETTLANMENCRTAWGTVVEIAPEQLLVQTRPLQQEDSKYILGKEETKNVVYDSKRFPDLKKGDVIAMHWGMACVVLTEQQIANLEMYTQKILDVMNTLTF